MADTTERILALLNLLQTHRHWAGRELAARLAVTERTVRRDIDRLRGLGYRVTSAPGVEGGYRLAPGNALPPLLLNDDEAVTIGIGLRLAATQRLVDGPHTTLSALAKIEQVLPPQLRARVNALAAAIRPTAVDRGSVVSGPVLGELALACRDRERLRFTYVSAAGEQTERRVEPHVLAPADRHWYLLAWDLDRDDWRTFRVDRLSEVAHTHMRFEPRPITPEEADELIFVSTSGVRTKVQADIVIEMSLHEMTQWFGNWSRGASEDADGRTRWPAGGNDVREMMYAMSWVPPGVGYQTDLAEPHRSELREILERMVRALGDPPPSGEGA
ncbi:helix-turn-helix transcriptional regulator [Pseudactinotalea terrae]|uniref:helix-turn-helix transcriptional regulator n=1 Tax=Pseudactinotalea terrae TaxID=1743262 RepID=UPI0012E29CC6|nr:YafY family protein [Pseudactinotalea terrae]